MFEYFSSREIAERMDIFSILFLKVFYWEVYYNVTKLLSYPQHNFEKNFFLLFWQKKQNHLFFPMQLYPKDSFGARRTPLEPQANRTQEPNTARFCKGAKPMPLPSRRLFFLVLVFLLLREKA